MYKIRLGVYIILMHTINNNIHIGHKTRNQREKSPSITMQRKYFVIISHTIYNYYL
jgi:hypothetical protein